MKCRHSWEFSHQTPNGEGRVFKYYLCRLCPQTSRRNVKKPRFTGSLPRQAITQRKQPKTSQKPPVRKRKAIRQVSKKRQKWNNLYEAKKKAEGVMVKGWTIFQPRDSRPFIAWTADLRKNFEPHHPLGRVGCRILFYVWVTPELHRYIHDNAEIARNRGWILPEMSGRESGPDQKDPFIILPDYRAHLAEHGLQ